MRLIQFEHAKQQKVGLELGSGGDVVDIAAAQSQTIPNNMVDFLAFGPEALKIAETALTGTQGRIPRSEIKLLAPVTKPDKVACIGMNYKDHCEEQDAPIPEEPVIFNKFPSTIVGPADDLQYPEVTEELDWEVEMVIVVGKKGKNIAKENAMEHVVGYTVAHDVSARDWQMKRNGRQWFVGKTMDSFCPLGPAVVTTDELGDPHQLGLRCRVNGVTKQDSNTNQLVFKTEELIAFTSKLFTLLPGDLILTGTPPGVGVFRKPPEFLKRGDVVECEIDGIGTITNKVV